MNIQSAFQAKENLEAISQIVYMMSKNNYGVELDGNFSQQLFKIMNNVFSQFGKKPKDNISDQAHLKNLNKLVIDDCLKYVAANQGTLKNNSSGGLGNQLNGPNSHQPYGPNGNQPNGPYGNQPNGPNGNQPNGPYGNQPNGPNGPYGNQPNGPNGPYGNQPNGPYGNQPYDPYGSFSNQPNGPNGPNGPFSNQPYGSNGNQPFGPNGNQPFGPNGPQPIPAQLESQNTKVQSDSGDLVKMVDRLAHERGYNLPQDMIATPRPDFTMPTEPHGTDPNLVLEKLKQERLYGINSGSLNLNELMGTQKKSDPLDQLVSAQEQSKQKPDTTQDASSEYLRRLEAINGRNDAPQQNTSNLAYQEDFLSLDLRQDLVDIHGEGGYGLDFSNFPNIIRIELVSCMINAHELIEQEPYIYFDIEEIDGNYALSNNIKVFGKLFPEKKVGNFIEFRPEKCIKVWTTPVQFNQLTISLRKFNQKQIPLHTLSIKKIIKQLSTNRLKIITKEPHYLSVDEMVNINTYEKNQKIVDTFPVLEVLDSHTFMIENSYDQISPNLSLDRRDIKCSLTFNLRIKTI